MAMRKVAAMMSHVVSFVAVFCVMGQAWADAPLMIVEAQGGNARMLVSMPSYKVLASPRFSHDKKRLTFDAWNQPADTHVCVAAADGSDPKDIAPGAMPDWSPDDKQIVFHSFIPRQGILVMNPDGAGRQWLCPGFGPRWSPDGSLIACVSYHEKGPGLYVFDTLEAKQRKVLDGKYRLISHGLDWAPDGTQVCFTGMETGGKRFLATVEVADVPKPAKVLLHADVGWRASWSPDGKRIAFSLKPEGKQHEAIHTIEVVQRGTPSLLAGQPEDRDNRDPCWSSDGAQIIFSSSTMP